ncbi:MAG: septal ring lytic transglycosylase RlpA family protein [Hyphomicrobium aestuarii]|nr:septal ring lytic transglycosylase RlpA family protein [Hyphomicrobium aestuarii]
MSYHAFKRLVGASILAVSAGLAAPAAVEAKTPGKTYCFLGVCHKVLTLSEVSARVGKTSLLNTSYYDHCKSDRYNPCGLTSSGEVFNAGRADNAASPILPNGTVILVRNPANGRSAVLRVNNAGPYWGKRTLDVSRAAADALAFRKRGVAKLEVKVLKAPSKAEAGYQRNRRYAKVSGPIGQFSSLTAAEQRYAAVTGTPVLSEAPTAMAAIYPQGQGSVAGSGPSLTGIGNGIERTWLSKMATFKPTKREAKQAKASAAKVALLIAPSPRSKSAASQAR